MPRASAKPVTEAEIESLAGLDLAALRSVWESRFGPAPKLRSPELLRHLLAWAAQRRMFAEIADEHRHRIS